MELQIYDRPNCNLFDLLGYKEIAQTKGLGYLLANSTEAMRAFLGLFFVSKIAGNYMKWRWKVDCEPCLKPGICSSGKPDIVLRFYDGYNLKKAIIIEAKNSAKRISNSGAITQVNTYKKMLVSLTTLNNNDITLITLTTYISVIGTDIKTITWQDIMLAFSNCDNKKTLAPFEKQLIRDYVKYILKIQNTMNYYDNEVLIIPASKTIRAVEDKDCSIYECPVKQGQFNSRANAHPLYLAFKAKGEFKTLFKVQAVVQLDINDMSAINSLDSLVENGIYKYPNLKDRIAVYKKYVPKVSGMKWVFLLDYDNAINLYYPVLVPSGARGIEYRTLKEIFNSKISENCGRIVMELSAKGAEGTNTRTSIINP